MNAAGNNMIGTGYVSEETGAAQLDYWVSGLELHQRRWRCRTGLCWE